MAKKTKATAAQERIERLAGIHEVLDGVIDARVRLHRQREAGTITVPTYLAGLEAVRHAERACELLRQTKGIDCLVSRAYELALADRQRADDASPL